MKKETKNPKALKVAIILFIICAVTVICALSMLCVLLPSFVEKGRAARNAWLNGDSDAFDELGKYNSLKAMCIALGSFFIIGSLALFVNAMIMLQASKRLPVSKTIDINNSKIVVNNTLQVRKVKCQFCGVKYDSTLGKCPHCGGPNPND